MLRWHNKPATLANTRPHLGHVSPRCYRTHAGGLCQAQASADLRKAGHANDLPIAVALISSTGIIPSDLSRSVFLGELAKSGTPT